MIQFASLSPLPTLALTYGYQHCKLRANCTRDLFLCCLFFFSFLSWKCKIKYKKILCAQSLQWREAGEVTVTLALLHVLIYMEDLQRKWEDFLFCLPRWTLTKSSLDVGIWNEVISSSALVKLKCRHLFFVLIFFLLMLKKKNNNNKKTNDKTLLWKYESQYFGFQLFSWSMYSKLDFYLSVVSFF